MKEGRGSGGLPPEAEAFSEFLDVRGAISRLLSITMCNVTTSRRGWGQGGLPPEAEAFFEFLDAR